MEKTQAGERELRALATQLEVRADADQPATLVGYASVFNSETNIGGFTEVIRPGAFARALREGQDVRALFNHNASMVLGRSKSGTLRMAEDNRGLRVEIDLPATQLGRDIAELVRRGDVTGMSFGFISRRETWNETSERVLREVLDADLFDVSVVTEPAYPDATVGLRSLEAWREQANQEAAPTPAGQPRQTRLTKARQALSRSRLAD